MENDKEQEYLENESAKAIADNEAMIEGEYQREIMENDLLLTDVEIRQAAGGHNTSYEQKDNEIGYSLNEIRKVSQAQLSKVLKAGYMKPPKSMELTELAEILYNLTEAGLQNIKTVKANIQNFLLANHYVQLADNQSLLDVSSGEHYFRERQVQQDMLKGDSGGGWRKIKLEGS